MNGETNEISVLVMAVERLSEAQHTTNEKVDKLIESMGKQEVILEKLANMEKAQTESQSRVHHRIDANEKDVKSIFEIHKTGCMALQNHKTERLADLKRYDVIINNFEKRITNNENILKELKDIPNKIMVRVIMVAISAITAGAIGVYFFDKG